MPIQGRSRQGIVSFPVGGGIVRDDVQHELSEPIWTDGLNVRFADGFARKTLGYEQALTTVPAAVLHVAPLQTQQRGYWVSATANALYADDGIAQSNITGAALTGTASDRFTSCVLGGVLVLNNGVDVPQYWGGSGTAATLTAWNTAWRAKFLRSFKNYLIAGNITKSGSNFASMVKWSHAAAPGYLPDSWDESDPTRDAGELDVAETDDELVDGLQMGNTFVLYKDRSSYGMQFIANNDIFRVFRLPGGYGILSQNCVANTPIGHVVLTNGPDVIVHYGNEPRSILQGKWRNWLAANIDLSNYRAAFVVANVAAYEVWICIPTTGNSYCNRAIVWNWLQDTLTMISLPSVTHAGVGLLSASDDTFATATGTFATDDTPFDVYDVAPRMLCASSDAKLYLMDEGDTANGAQIAATITRTGLTFGDPDQVKLLRSVTLRVDAPAGTVLSVEGANSNDVEGSYAFTTPVTYTVGTSRKADLLCSGRFLGVRISSAAGGNWRIKSIGYDVVPLGGY